MTYHLFPEILFWLSALAILYAYLGYPALLWLVSRFVKRPVKKADIKPSVSLVISVYNEERVLAQKIENVLSLTYPKELLEIAIISDGSTDRTNEIIEEYARRDERILPCVVPVNQGKSACLNDFVPKLRGEVILFSDANALYPDDLILEIVSPFADAKIGFVTGSTQYYSSFTCGNGQQAIGLYSNLERFTKKMESNIGSCVGADGAVFAIRKSLFSGLGQNDINDLVIPLAIVKKGYRGIIEENAFCREKAAPAMAAEFRRQVRITNRTLRALYHYRHLLNPFKRPLFALMLFSHKVMKLASPFSMIVLLGTNVVLAFDSPLYIVLLVLQLLFYMLIFIGHKSAVPRDLNRLTSLAYTFGLTSLAVLKGWTTFLAGETYSTWSPERRQQDVDHGPLTTDHRRRTTDHGRQTMDKKSI